MALVCQASKVAMLAGEVHRWLKESSITEFGPLALGEANA
jgi:hypothetical protein